MSLPEPHTSVSRLPPAAHLPASSLLGTGAASALWFWLACIATLLMLCTVGVSAFIRLAQAEHVCKHWLSCAGGADISQALSAWVSGARQVHRVLATGFLALALVLALGTRTTGLRHPARLALGVLALSLGLAALGIIGRNSTVPAVVLGNLLGGMVTLALCVRLAAVAGGAPAPSTRLRGWLRLALLLALLQASLGGLVSAGFAATSCGSWAECSSAAFAASWDWRFLDPWLAPGPDALAPLQPRGTWLQWLHRAGALLLLAAAAAAAWRAALERRRLLALGLAGLLALQLTNGLLMAPATLALPQVLVHNLVSALLLALLARSA